jgi:hypothetical protein
MASKHIVGIEVADEATYGSVGTAGYPDGTGLGAWAPMEIADRAQLVPVGDPVFSERSDPRDNWHGTPPEPVVADAGGVVRRGQLQVDTWVRPRGDGTVYPTYAAHPLVKILSTRMGLLDVPLAYSFSPASVAGLGAITAVHGNNFAPGQALRLQQSGVAQYLWTTQVDEHAPMADEIIRWSPELGALPILADVIFPLPTLVQRRPDFAAPSSSVALRVTGHGWRATCYGCVLSAISLTMQEGSRAWRLSLTIEIDWVTYSTPGTLPALPVYGDGQIVHGLAAPMVLSVPFNAVAGAGVSLARSLTPCVDSFTLSCQWQLAQRGCGASWLGRQVPEATDLDCSLEVIVPEYLPALADDYRLRRYRNLVMGGSAYDGTAGEGACFYLPAAYLAEEPIKPDVGADNLRTRLMYRPGAWTADASSGGVPPPQVRDNSALNTIFRLALG